MLVREHYEPFYRRIDDRLEDYILDNELRRYFEVSMRDGSMGRRNAAFVTGAGVFTPQFEDIRLPNPKAVGKIRKLLRTQWCDSVMCGGTSNTMVHNWMVNAGRRGDQIGSYPNDHDVSFSSGSLADDPAFVARTGDAVFAMFLTTLRTFPPIAGWVSMSGSKSNHHFDHDNGFHNPPADPPPFTGGYHWAMFIPTPDIDTLGGLDTFTKSALVEEIVEIGDVDGAPSPGVAARLRRDITTDSLQAWRATSPHRPNPTNAPPAPSTSSNETGHHPRILATIGLGRKAPQGGPSRRKTGISPDVAACLRGAQGGPSRRKTGISPDVAACLRGAR